MRISDWSSDVCSSDLISREAVELSIEEQDIDARFAQNAQQRRCDALLDERPDARFGDVASCGDPRNLGLGGGGRDVWIKARAGCGHQIARERSCDSRSPRLEIGRAHV